MLAYSLLLGARNILGFRVFLQEDVLHNLKYYFPLANEVRMHEIYLVSRKSNILALTVIHYCQDSAGGEPLLTHDGVSVDDMVD